MTSQGSQLRALLGLSPALFFLLLAGCAHSAGTPATSARPPLDAGAAARSVVLCQTTEAELRQRLGKPTRDGILHKAHIMSWILRPDSPAGYLAVMLDERGVVVDLYWDIPTEVPWVPTDQCGPPKIGEL